MRPAVALCGRLALAAGALVLAGEAVARWGLGLGTPPLYRADPQLEYQLKPGQEVHRFHNRVAINRWGMRAEPLAPTPAAGRRRVLLFGDSVLFGGSQLDQRLIASELLHQRLNAGGAGGTAATSPVEVGNVSAGSWGPGNWRAWVQRHGVLGASDVVLVVSSHDARDNPTFAPLDANHPERPPASALAELLQRYAWPAAAATLPGLIPAPAGVPPEFQVDATAPAALQRGLADLAAFLQLARASGARVRAVQFWERSEVIEGRPLPDHAAIAAVLRAQGVPAVQSGPAFRRCSHRAGHGYDDLFVDKIHPFTPAGQACLAGVLEQALAAPAAGQTAPHPPAGRRGP